jgi:hypothetical protein
MIFFSVYKKSYNLNIKLNYDFRTWKIKHVLHLLWLMFVWLHPHH